MARTLRTDDELRAASDHLYYEIQMLQGTMALLATGATGESILSNALIESFTIHARSLLHFLYPMGSIQPSDVLAKDFFDGVGHWLEIRPDEPKMFGTARGRVNKEIAHLTYDRQLITPELKGWDFVDLGDEILKIVRIFMSAIPPRLLGQRWQQVNAEYGNDISMVPSQVAEKDRAERPIPRNV